MGNWFSSGRTNDVKDKRFTTRYGWIYPRPVAIKSVVPTVVPTVVSNINNSKLQPASNRPPPNWKSPTQTPIQLITTASNPQSVVSSNSNGNSNGNNGSRNRSNSIKSNTIYEVVTGNENVSRGGSRSKKNKNRRKSKRTRKNHKKGL
jgi:hypothetical protein